MSKHTAAPWDIEYDNDDFGGRWYHVGPAKVTFHDGEDVAEANACLIAAAPEMLEALKDVRPMVIAWAAAYQEAHNLRHQQIEHRRAIAALDDAIAKAEGKQ